MKIWGDIPKVLGIYDKQKNVGKVDKANAVASKKDVVSISDKAKDYQTVIRALKDIPDVRADKVAELSEKYQAGNYNISGNDIADKVIRTVFDKKA